MVDFLQPQQIIFDRFTTSTNDFKQVPVWNEKTDFLHSQNCVRRIGHQVQGENWAIPANPQPVIFIAIAREQINVTQLFYNNYPKIRKELQYVYVIYHKHFFNCESGSRSGSKFEVGLLFCASYACACAFSKSLT